MSKNLLSIDTHRRRKAFELRLSPHRSLLRFQSAEGMNSLASAFAEASARLEALEKRQGHEPYPGSLLSSMIQGNSRYFCS